MASLRDVAVVAALPLDAHGRPPSLTAGPARRLLGDRDAAGHGLVAHIDHAGGALFVEEGEAAEDLGGVPAPTGNGRPVRGDLGVTEQVHEPVLHALAHHVLPPAGLGVHLFQRHSDDVDEEALGAQLDEVSARVEVFPLAGNPRAKMRSLRRGFVKLFCRKNSGMIIGGVLTGLTLLAVLAYGGFFLLMFLIASSGTAYLAAR